MCELDLYFIGLSEIHWVCGQDLSKIHQLLWKLRLCSCGRAANPDCHLKARSLVILLLFDNENCFMVTF